MYCERCNTEPAVHETGDCPECGESMWTAKSTCVVVRMAGRFAEFLAELADPDDRYSALSELARSICLHCWKVRKYGEGEPCCQADAKSREQLAAFSKVLAEVQDRHFRRATAELLKAEN